MKAVLLIFLSVPFSAFAVGSPCADTLAAHRESLGENEFRFWRADFYNTAFGKQCLEEFRSMALDSSKSTKVQAAPASATKPKTKKRQAQKKEGKK